MTRFTRVEQRTLMSLWSIAQSPLMFGGDLPSNDDFTLALISNDEVLAVNQKGSHGREFYWLCRIRTSESIVWRLPEIKAVALKTSTMRNITMIRKLAAKFPAT